MKKTICIAALVLLLLTGCNNSQDLSSDKTGITDELAEKFTTDMTASHDGKFYAIMGIKNDGENSHAVVNIFSDTGDSVYSFDAGSTDSFFGVYWENATYNIWVLSSDEGLICYRYKEDEWIADKTAQFPEDIK